MPFPNFAGKHALDPLITPRDMLAYRERAGRRPTRATPFPNGVVVCYRHTLVRHVVETEATEPLGGAGYDVHVLTRTGGRVGVVGGFGIGAPVAAVVVEELIALGARAIVTIGTAGGLQTDGAIGDVVLCTEAVRDEGVSHHYLPPAPRVRPSAALTARLRRSLARSRIPFTEGPTWTIDAPYRETIAEVRHNRAAGVATVEMEAAAVFAVAAHRGVAATAAFAISDTLREFVWDPRFGSPRLQHSLRRLLDASVAPLAGDEAGGDPGTVGAEGATR